MYETFVNLISWALAIIFLGFGLLAIWKIWGMDLSKLIAESDGSKASLSRFQLLLFTFVIAGLYLILSIEAGDFIEIPESVLGLLGISGGSYLISKGISSGKTATPVGGPADRGKNED